MTTVQGLTLGVKSVAATVQSRPSPVLVALHPASISFTSASLPQQPTYKEVAQRQSGSKPDQTKQPKLQTPATYKRIPVKAQVATASHTELQGCEISGPPSFDPYDRGASTTGDYYSAASGLMTGNTRTTKGDTEYQTAASSNPNTKNPTLFTSQEQLRPLASSTQRKTTSKRSLNLETVEESAKDNVPNAIHVKQ